MKFQELCDLVELAVNGGEFTSEAAVMLPDIEAYIPAAAHAAIREAIFQNKADQRADRASIGIGGSPVSPGFYRTYEVSVIYDSDRKIHYADLPGIVQDWQWDLAVGTVFAKQRPDVIFTKLDGPAEYAAVVDIGMSVFWHETNPLATATRLFLPTADDDPCTLMVRAALQILPSLGDEEIPLPSPLQEIVIQKAVAHFRGQRQMPADQTLTNTDVNAANEVSVNR